jgi:FkbM family methyltransferase
MRGIYDSVSGYVLDHLDEPLRWWARHGRPNLSRKLVMASLLPAFTKNPPVRDFTCTTLFGSTMSGNTRDAIPSSIFWLGAIEENLTFWFQEQLRPGDVFVDVGAHVGYFSLLASRCVGEAGRVVAVEASPKTYALLLDNLALNEHARNVRALNVAAGSHEGTIPFYRSGDTTTGISSTRMRPGAALEAEVRVAPLATLLDDDLERVRLVKIDVEGAEFEAVEGLLSAADRLRRDAEIVVETSADWEHRGRRADANDLIDVFRAHGFHAYKMVKELLVTPKRYARPVRQRGRVETGYFDLVFSRRDQERL